MSAILSLSNIGRRSLVSPPEEHMELRQKHTLAVHQLGSSLGLTTSQGLGGVPVVSLSEDKLLQIVQISKGRKLIVRALPLLSAPQADVLLPVMVKYLVRLVCSPESSSDDQVDEDMGLAIAGALRREAPSPVPLPVLTQCLRNINSTQTAETLPVILQHKNCAIVVEALLTTGGSASVEGRPGADQWTAAFNQLKLLVTGA
jgi:hypothetical protein